MKVCNILDLEPGTLVRHYREHEGSRLTQWGLVVSDTSSDDKSHHFKAIAWIEKSEGPGFPIVLVHTPLDLPVFSTDERVRIFANLNESEMQDGPPSCPSEDLIVVGDTIGFSVHLATDNNGLQGYEHFVTLDGQCCPLRDVIESSMVDGKCYHLAIRGWSVGLAPAGVPNEIAVAERGTYTVEFV